MDEDDAATAATLTASRALLGIVARSLAPVTDAITMPQFRALVLLSSGGAQRMGVLAEQLGVSVSTFTRTADRLVARGWAVRESNPDSRREVNLVLTSEGLALVRSVTEHRRRLIGEVLARMSAEDRALVATALSVFSTAAGEPSAGDLLILGV